MIRRDRIEALVSRLSFPASKEEIVRQAREREAGSEELMFFESIPDLHYERPEEVTEMIEVAESFGESFEGAE